jgi:hypothetical protein
MASSQSPPRAAGKGPPAPDGAGEHDFRYRVVGRICENLTARGQKKFLKVHAAIRSGSPDQWGAFLT